MWSSIWHGYRVHFLMKLNSVMIIVDMDVVEGSKNPFLLGEQLKNDHIWYRSGIWLQRSFPNWNLISLTIDQIWYRSGWRPRAHLLIEMQLENDFIWYGSRILLQSSFPNWHLIRECSDLIWRSHRTQTKSISNMIVLYLRFK